MRLFLIELQLAWCNLLARRRRTWLLGAAIATITCLFVLMSGLSLGINRAVFQSAVTLAAGHLNVAGVYKATPSQVFPLVTEYERVIRVVERLPEVETVVRRGRGGGKIVSDTASIDSGLIGVDLAAEPSLRQLLVVASGSLDELARPNAVVFFERQATTLGVTVGDAVTIVSQTARGVSNTVDCRVVAVVKDVGLLSAFSTLVSATTLAELLQLRSDAAGVLQVHVKPDYLDDLPRVADELRKQLQAAGFSVAGADPRPFFEKLEAMTRTGWTGQKLDVSTWQDEVSFIDWSRVALETLSLLLVGVVLGMTVAGIMNSFWIAVRERTREVGTLRAIGMQRASVARMFLFEAGLLGLLASIGGVVLGLAVTAAINQAALQVPLSMQLILMRETVAIAWDWQAVCLVLLAMTLSASVASLYPALRAARRDPSSALAHWT